jgi:dipeptidyl-peptidase 4
LHYFDENKGLNVQFVYFRGMKNFAIVTLCLLFVSVAYAQELSLENIWGNASLSAKSASGFKMLQDGKSYCKLERTENKTLLCVRYELETGNKLGVIFSTQDILLDSMPLPLEGFEFSDDESKVLISNGFEAVYRHSGKSNYFLYDLKTKKLSRISNKKIMYATLSPDAGKVAYVGDNNLYYYDLTKKKEVQITKDGEKNKIINGAVDWVYEEEFSMSKGFEWSPNSQFIAYYKFNEEKVPTFSMDIYGTLYPQKETWKYPKAGESNSKVDVFIHKIGSKKDVLCETNSENDQYLPRIQWMSDNFLSVMRLNRLQNHLEMLKFSYYYNKADVFYTEDNKRYIDVNDWHFYSNVDSTLPYAVFTSEKSGYNHLYAMDKKYNVIQLTKGSFDVDVLSGAANSKIYFTAGVSSAIERQLYSVDVNNHEMRQMTQEKGVHTVAFSSTCLYYMDVYSSLSKAPVYCIKNLDGKVLRVLEDNKALMDKLSACGLGQLSFGVFENSEGDQLDYWQILPPNFDSTKKYPVLFFVYGGPGHQTVINRWAGANYLWYQYMAQKGYIIVSVDNTGSGGKGEEFKKKTYLNLGKYETRDYMEAATWFSKMSFVDGNRIGVFGWSYGGFMASNLISIGSDVFSTAVAVAPVTNWRYYDNIYTERYMRTPQENASGYDDNSPLSHINKIRGNYLIVHGTADDNVHFQNSAEMVMAMNANNIKYESAYYPNTNHGIRGGKIRLHLFTKITDYFLEHL